LAVPDTVVLDELALGDDAAGEAGAEDDDEDDADAEDDDEDEELHAAAARPRHVMPSTAATRLLDDRNVRMLSTLASVTCAAQEEETLVLTL